MQKAAQIVRRLWEFCGVLRDDGMSYPDYVEQLTYLLFLKMASEGSGQAVPREFAWESLMSKDAKALHAHYSRALNALGKHGGMLGLIFSEARNKIRDPAKLKLLVTDLIGTMDWSSLSPDVKGDAYEGLLEKNARDTKSGAGQYFTPRPLIDAIVSCVNPMPGEVVCDPACGTGGFLLAAHAHILRNRLTAAQQSHLRKRALRGVELVSEVARLAAMNLLLHGVGGVNADELPITCGDSLEKPGTAVDVVLTNPPFGVKGTVTYRSAKERGGNGELVAVRPDFWVETANKQLNFVQHVANTLAPGGRAAMVLPDNVLFERGASAAVRRRLLETCAVHTLLRLPAGLFYAQSVNANVLFFDRRANRRGQTGKLALYDLRNGKRYSRTRPLQDGDLEEFVELYQKRPSEAREHWQCFDIEGVLASKGCSLDLALDRVTDDQYTGVDRIDQISKEIMDDLEIALSHIRKASDTPARS